MKRNGEWIAEGIVFTASILAAWISRAWMELYFLREFYIWESMQRENTGAKRKSGEIYAQIERVLRGDYTTAFKEYQEGEFKHFAESAFTKLVNPFK